jgi:hypothetical protein
MGAERGWDVWVCAGQDGFVVQEEGAVVGVECEVEDKRRRDSALRSGRVGSLLPHFGLASLQEGRRDEKYDSRFVRRPMPRHKSKTC